MRNIFKILLFGLITISCSRDEDNPVTNEPLTTKMYVGLLYPGTLRPNQVVKHFYFEYNTNKKLTKKVGGFLQSEIGSYFTDQVYTSLTYKNNKVTVENFSSSANFTVPKDTKYYTLNSSNQITTKEIPRSGGNSITDSYMFKKQTFIYVDNRLSEIKTALPNMPYDPNESWDYILTYLEKFYYDTNGNLTKTEYFELRNGINIGEKIVRTFEDYDNSTNPFKRLQLLDEFFYRSLSKNNFRKYSEAIYTNNELTSSKTNAWNLNYDSNGKIIID